MCYHPWRRLWRLMVYSLVTTSSFLPLVFSNTIFTLVTTPYLQITESVGFNC
ncbi:hypothetical protein Hanom_Chr04g00340151 [Helianthus anomalus]